MRKMTSKEINTLAAKALAVFLADYGPCALTLDGGSCGQIGAFLGGTLIRDSFGDVALCDALQIETGKMVFVTPLPPKAVELMAAGNGDDGTWHLGVCVPALDEDAINAKYSGMSEFFGRKIEATRKDRIRYMAVAMELLGRTVDDRIEQIDREMETTI
ncbi:MAG: hypothetical protein AB7E51_02540 [Pseudodesulfovibrio sp.]|uniref:hypothetical protein n=1 Tax=Pseudodesulfovibrio sp. TaxID=2035812 RepID=UPI003D150D11